jgi:hypothetical protein
MSVCPPLQLERGQGVRIRSKKEILIKTNKVFKIRG